MTFDFGFKNTNETDKYLLSKVLERLQQRLSSSDQVEGWRQGQSPRRWASKAWSALACPWWSGSSRTGRACPRPGCTAQSEPALNSRPDKKQTLKTRRVLGSVKPTNMSLRELRECWEIILKILAKMMNIESLKEVKDRHCDSLSSLWSQKAKLLLLFLPGKEGRRILLVESMTCSRPCEASPQPGGQIGGRTRWSHLKFRKVSFRRE